MTEEIVAWNLNDIVEVKLKKHTDYFKVNETLTRMGIPSFAKKQLYQTAHIFRDDDRYYVVHFKELFGLDGRHVTMTKEDFQRRNLIIGLLQEWELLTVVDPNKIEKRLPITYIKVLPYKEKNQWKLVSKYFFKKTNEYTRRKVNS